MTTARTDRDGLTRQELSDLAWLLSVLDDWLLYAEPSTVRELGQFMRSVGIETAPPTVLCRLGELRRRVQALSKGT